MTRISYGIEIFDTHSRRIDFPAEITSIEYARAVNNVGTAIVKLPLTRDVLPIGNNYVMKIYRVGPYDTVTLAGRTHWFINKVTYLEDEREIEIAAVCPNFLLKKRIVAYTSQTPYADKTREEFLIDNYDPLPAFCIDNMMRQYVRENMGSEALDPLRDLSPDVEVEADLCLGEQGEKQAGFANLLSTSQELTSMSEDLGTPLYFELTPRGSGLFFRVSAWYLNENHGSNTLWPVIFNAEMGQLSDVSMSFDWTEEGNVVYVQGEDSGSAKLYETMVDSIRSTDGLFARSEFIHDAGSEASSIEYLQSQGRSALSSHRPRIRLKANVVDDIGLVYGADYGFGDGVVAAYRGYQFNCIVRAERVSYQNGEENLDISLEGEIFFERAWGGGGADGGSGGGTYPTSTPPVITVLGTNPLTVELGSVYVDAGATAFDAEDGDITASIVVGGDTVNTAVPGIYVITYDVTDSSGITAIQKTRTVTVSGWVVPMPGDPTVWYGSPAGYILWDGAHVMRTWNVSTASPTWELVDTGITGAIYDGQYIHVNSTTVGMWLLTANGVWWCANIMATTPSWTLKLALTTVQAADAVPAAGVVVIQSIANYASEPGYLIAITGPNSEADHNYAHAYSWHTHDYGATWTQVDMNGYLQNYQGDYIRGYCISDLNSVEIFRSAPGTIYCVRSISRVVFQVDPRVFISSDLGHTWTKGVQIKEGYNYLKGTAILHPFPSAGDPSYAISGSIGVTSRPALWKSIDGWLTATKIVTSGTPVGYGGVSPVWRPNKRTFNTQHLMAWFLYGADWPSNFFWHLLESADAGATWSLLLNSGLAGSTTYTPMGASSTSRHNTPNGWPPDINSWFVVRTNVVSGSPVGVIQYTADKFATALVSKVGNLAAILPGGLWTNGPANGFALPRVGENA